MENQLDNWIVELQKKHNQIIGDHLIEVLHKAACCNHNNDFDTNGTVLQNIKSIKAAPVLSNKDKDCIIAVGIPNDGGLSFRDILGNHGCPIILLSIDVFREDNKFDIDYFAPDLLFDGFLGNLKHISKSTNDINDCENILTKIVTEYTYV